jgi:chemotaxis signal transduction protein
MTDQTTEQLGFSVDQVVRLDGFRFIVALPENAGRVCGLAHYRGKLLIITDMGHLYEFNGESEVLRSLPNLGVW